MFTVSWGMILSLNFLVRLFVATTESCHLVKHCFLANGKRTGEIHCRTLRPSETYTNLNYQWNLHIPQIDPMGYFLPKDTQEIQICIRCAQLHNIRVIAKSGGHSYGKYSFGDSKTLVIDLQKMDNVQINSKESTVDVGPGLLSGPLTEKLFQNGKNLLPNGLCPTVGISYCLGGGYSFLSRRYGLVLDNLQELEMVDVHGDVLIANEIENKNLFWALRGAGGGSFGIVSRYIFKIHKAPSQIVYGRSVYNIIKFPNVFDAFQLLALSNPPRSINCIVTVNQTSILIEVIEILPPLNSSPANCIHILASHFPSQSTSTQTSVLKFYDYLTTVGAYGGNSLGIANATRHDYAPIYFQGTSFYVQKKVFADGIREIDKLIQVMAKYITVEIQLHGGAINDLKSSDTAYIHRKPNLYKANPDYIGLPYRSEEEEAAALDWLKIFFATTRRVMHHKESYQNNVDPDLKDYLKRYYGKNLQRLIQVKRMYDPTNYFNNPQSIPTAWLF